ncbi:hypothetical protein AAWM_11149 [Aspergillus awamori]|uniref:Lysine-specific metallo-endopeptidase domain-containing protein n=1 Tax=Aspergillus awamori TaxID=105351 RepID=A0A401L9T8_ASPAW|nr:hypothetical protein AAWM_11149 [Aspergillus awamori]GKZ57620.1 hypothetical protein AnigIFM49718_002942 [Aspergillus niger]GKZ99405.1 hypothetical protein AnigIFM60653_005149 [Aspergillus niger]GLA19677.1 hypothetical protein AnigIFM62618_007796 [Aspergillus niger]
MKVAHSMKIFKPALVIAVSAFLGLSVGTTSTPVSETQHTILAAEDEFTTALTLSNYDLSEFTSYNFSTLYTKLIGFDGCSAAQRTQIYSGWQQSWKIMNHIYWAARKGIDYDEFVALEFLAPSLRNGDQRSQFREIFMNLATIQPGWLPSWLDWKLSVRCDDPESRCPSPVHAYAGQNDTKYDVAYINFCEEYFSLQTLDEVMRYTNRSEYDDPNICGNMYLYCENQARVWLHELLHIDWVSKANQYGRNNHVTDMKVGYRNFDGSTTWFSAYGPLLCKALARATIAPGFWVIQNADSLTMYMIAKYVQDKMGAYPHLPWAPEPPSSVDKPMEVGNLFTVYPNGTGFPSTNNIPDDELESVDDDNGYSADNENSVDAHPDKVMVKSWPLRTDYPAAYLSIWSSWAGRTAAPTSVVESQQLSQVLLVPQ